MPPAAALPALALRGVSLRYGARPLFEGIDLALAPRDRACLVGRNGTGKSTLLKVLAGLVEPDQGERFVQPGTKIAYLPQEADFTGFATVGDFVAADLAAGNDHRAAAALDLLELDPRLTVTALSGGEQRRAAVARALAGAPDVLLLDEPTNHLDLPTIEMLEAQLGSFRGALLLISHDRAFLKALSRRTYWLDRGVLRTAEQNFTDFEEWRDQVLAAEEVARHKQDRRIAAETLWQREGLSARRRRNQGRVRALEALRQVKRERQKVTGQVAFDPGEATRSGALVIEAKGISKHFIGPSGERAVVRNFSTRIMRGDRVGIIGPNGAGKTTLVRLLTGSLSPDSGSVRIGSNVELALFDQARAALPAEGTVRNVLVPEGGDMVSVRGQMRHLASYLQDFLFDGSRMDSPVRALSGGERARLVLARLFAQPSNLVVLDEPTNDLDMETLDLLEDVLGDYAGTLLLVSHDRDFLDRLVGSVIAVEGDGRVREYAGGYTDYVRQRPPPPPPKPAAAKPARPSAPSRPPAARRISFTQQRELDRLPATIAALTAEVSRLTARLGDPELYARDPAGFASLSAKLAEAEAAVAAAEERWLELASLAEGG